jgi:nucleoside-diphosphate-sugar epimerase
MYVSDAIRGVLAVLGSEEVNHTLDFGSGTPLTINELVRTAARVFGCDVELEHTGQVPEYIHFSMSGEAMERLYGFHPRVPLEEGLVRLAEHLRVHRQAQA